MNSQWPELKKEMDKIPVPIEKLDLIISNTIKDHRNKRSKVKVAFYSLGAAALGFGLFLGSAYVWPTIAKIAAQMPVIGKFFNDSYDVGLRIAGQKGLSQVVNQTAKDKGITLTINEIFYDGTRLALGYTMESKVAIDIPDRPTIEVNGKEINFSSGYGGEYITPQKFRGTIEIKPTEDLPKEFDMKITIDAIGSIPGNWQFAFPVKQSNEVMAIKPEQKIMIEGAEVEVSSIKIGPAGTALSLNVKKDRFLSRLDPLALEFHMIDDNGNVLDLLDSHAGSIIEYGREFAELDRLYEPLKEGTKKVRVVPYIVGLPEDFSEKVSVPLDQKNLPFVLEQGEFGNIVVTEITYLKKKTVVQFEVQSDAIVDNHLEHNGIWLEDRKGNVLTIPSKPAERIKGNQFKQEFATGKQKGLVLKTMKYPKPVYYEEFTIEIR